MTAGHCWVRLGVQQSSSEGVGGGGRRPEGTKSSGGAAKRCTTPCRSTQDATLFVYFSQSSATKKVSVQLGRRVTLKQADKPSLQTSPPLLPRASTPVWSQRAGSALDGGSSRRSSAASLLSELRGKKFQEIHDASDLSIVRAALASFLSLFFFFPPLFYQSEKSSS